MTIKELYYYCEDSGRNCKVDKYVDALKNIKVAHNHQYLLGLLIEAKVSIDNVKKIASGEYDKIFTQRKIVKEVLEKYLWLKRPTHSYTYFTINDWCEEILKEFGA